MECSEVTQFHAPISVASRKRVFGEMGILLLGPEGAMALNLDVSRTDDFHGTSC